MCVCVGGGGGLGRKEIHVENLPSKSNYSPSTCMCTYSVHPLLFDNYLYMCNVPCTGCYSDFHSDCV